MARRGRASAARNAGRRPRRPPPPTKAERDIEATLAKTDDPVRAGVLRGARAFKRSWIEFAALLTRVRDEELYLEWGFETFERYCTKELHVRKETAYKLTGSYQFLRKEEPSVLRRDGLTSPLPDYRSVDALMKAQQHASNRSAPIRELRTAVLDEGLAPAATTARLREILPPPPRQPGDERREARRFAAQARRLLAGLQGSALLADEIESPESLTLDGLIDRLEEIAEA